MDGHASPVLSIVYPRPRRRRTFFCAICFPIGLPSSGSKSSCRWRFPMPLARRIHHSPTPPFRCRRRRLLAFAPSALRRSKRFGLICQLRDRLPRSGARAVHAIHQLGRAVPNLSHLLANGVAFNHAVGLRSARPSKDPICPASLTTIGSTASFVFRPARRLCLLRRFPFCHADLRLPLMHVSCPGQSTLA